MFKVLNVHEWLAMAEIIDGIVERVNGGQCAEYYKAAFRREYPACIWLYGRDGEIVEIFGIEAMTDTGNGYMIDYTTYDRETVERISGKLRLTFQ